MFHENAFRPGAAYLGHGRTRFCVWAPAAARVEVVTGAGERAVPLQRGPRGYHSEQVDGTGPGTRYRYRLDGAKLLPDPVSRFQPEGVHGPSQVMAEEFPWDDWGWHGIPLEAHVFYELHVGTFTPEGTFDAAIPHLEELRGLGVTAVEVMPVAQFPGSRNWGYDGVYPFAVQNSYGGPDGLKRFVNAAHKTELAVVLDVVYNHLGPEGNYLPQFGPYFTGRYRTPWGDAINFDGPASDEVRRYFIANALQWVTEFHIDGLRLDAVHAILDFSAVPFLEELGEAVKKRAGTLARRVHVIAESDLNDSRLVRPRVVGGMGLDAQWSDDFHHCLHTLITGEKDGYYSDFGRMAQLGKAFREGFVYSGEYADSRGRRHGNSSSALGAEQLVVCGQNHDQVGNRMLGERLSGLVDFEALKLSAAVTGLSPFLPLLFMGEEYAETAPFQYFVDHSDPALVEAVRTGRRKEFEAFGWKKAAPDPQDEGTFNCSKLNHSLRGKGRHRTMLEFYTELLRLRRTKPALACLSKERMEATASEKHRTLSVRRWAGADEVFVVFHFGSRSATVSAPLPKGRWHVLLNSAEKRWEGPGGGLAAEYESEGEPALGLHPHSAVVFGRTGE